MRSLSCSSPGSLCPFPVYLCCASVWISLYASFLEFSELLPCVSLIKFGRFSAIFQLFFLSLSVYSFWGTFYAPIGTLDSVPLCLWLRLYFLQCLFFSTPDWVISIDLPPSLLILFLLPAEIDFFIFPLVIMTFSCRISVWVLFIVSFSLLLFSIC